MTDEADKPLRDVEAEEASFTEEAPDNKSDRAGSRHLFSTTALFVALLALAGVVALAMYGYRLDTDIGLDMLRIEKTIEADVAGLKSATGEQVSQLSAAFREQSEQQRQESSRSQALVASLEAERTRYERGRQEMLEALNALQKRMGRSTSRWMAAEAEYLIRIANYRLQLETDADTALSALQAADERLRDTADPLWTPVREVLAGDIAALKGMVSPDYAGLSARLAGLIKQIGQLKPRTAPSSLVVQSSGEQKEMAPDWEQVLSDGWQGFRSLLVVRKHNQPVAAMLPPEQIFFLGQNLRLQLESARLALLRRDQALYDDSLASAGAWLRTYFDPEDRATGALLQELDELVGIRVRMPMPDISGALAVLRQRVDLSRIEMEPEVPETPETGPGGE